MINTLLFYIMAKKKPYNKYKIDKSEKGKKAREINDEHTGKSFIAASAIEKKFYDEVIIPKFKSGEIIDYDLQKEYVLQEKFKRSDGSTIRKVSYISDYWVLDSNNIEHVFDIKGAGSLVDSVATLKKKLFLYKYPELDFRWLTHSQKTNWIEWDVYMKIKRAEKKAKKDKKET